MDDVEARLAALEARVVELVAENERLHTENRALRERVARLEKEAGRNSDNSSKPPSTDGQEPRKKRAERRAEARKSKRKPGGQPGSPGSTLPRREPDKRVEHPPVACSCCGRDLGDAEVVGTEVRQVIDLPAIAPVVSDHVVEKRRCSCGTVTAGEFPPEARAPVMWGPQVRAAALFFMVGHHVPVARTAEILSDVLGAPVSTGWLCRIHLEAVGRLAPFITDLKDRLRGAGVVNADETGIRVATREGGVVKHWMHVACTELLTLLAIHPKRGADALRAIGVLPGFDGVIVHDGYTPYGTIDGDATRHAQCGVHILRHLEAVGEDEVHELWACQMTQILCEGNRHAQAAAAAGKAKVSARQLRRIRTRYRQTVGVALHLLPDGPPPNRGRAGEWREADRQAWNLATRLRRDEDQILRFLTDTQVPFSNNVAETALRMGKIHDKVSGTFRSPESARAFADIRSYLQTAGKHGLDRLDVLTQLFTTGPWIPPPAPG